MKPLLVTFVILVFQGIGFGQIKSSVDLIFGLDYSNRILTTDNNDLNLSDGSVSEREIGKLNFRTGFNYNQRLANKIYLKSGIRFASVGYTKEIKGLIFPSDIDPLVGITVDPNLPNEFITKKDYWFIEVPIMIRYELNEKKLSPFVEAGIATNFLMTTRRKTTIYKASELYESSVSFNQDSNISRLNFSANISLGLNYKLSDKWLFFAQPTFRYHLTRSVDSEGRENLYNVGIEFGMRMKIG